jgi:hypothetical protein
MMDRVSMKQIVSGNPIRRSFDLKVICLFIFVVILDLIFFGHSLGWMIGGFCLFFLAFISYYNYLALQTTFGKIFLLATSGQALVMLYDPNILSYSLYFSGVIFLTAMGKGYSSSNSLIWLRAIGTFLLSIIYTFVGQLNAFVVLKNRIKRKNKISQLLSRWTLAIILSSVFVYFFAMANPIIGNFFQEFDLKRFIPSISGYRLFFWMFIAILLFPFLKPPKFYYDDFQTDEGSLKKETWLFNKRSILNALILFNLVFLVQTFSDFIYLWGGAGLPDGLTYAAYAQQGAYPLMVTALLAGIFVIITLMSHNLGEVAKLIKGLIYFWVAQNVFLVISCILRTDLYIEQYSLTYLRFSSLIWMGLVATGLLAIIICMARNKSYIWLVNVNIIITACVIYVCSIINIGGIIANYNVRHSYELTGKGAMMDWNYLYEIGTDSLPAINWFKENTSYQGNQSVEWVEKSLKNQLYKNLSDWRSWTFKEYLLIKNNNY